MTEQLTPKQLSEIDLKHERRTFEIFNVDIIESDADRLFVIAYKHGMALIQEVERLIAERDALKADLAGMWREAFVPQLNGHSEIEYAMQFPTHKQAEDYLSGTLAYPEHWEVVPVRVCDRRVELITEEPT